MQRRSGQEEGEEAQKLTFAILVRLFFFRVSSSCDSYVNYSIEIYARAFHSQQPLSGATQKKNNCEMEKVRQNFSTLQRHFLSRIAVFHRSVDTKTRSLEPILNFFLIGGGISRRVKIQKKESRSSKASGKIAQLKKRIRAGVTYASRREKLKMVYEGLSDERNPSFVIRNVISWFEISFPSPTSSSSSHVI